MDSKTEIIKESQSRSLPYFRQILRAIERHPISQYIGQKIIHAITCPSKNHHFLISKLDIASYINQDFSSS
jgi:hypothetical protein